MQTLIRFSMSIALLSIYSSAFAQDAAVAEPPADTAQWTNLLDEELSQWENWIGVPHSTVKGLPRRTQPT